MTLLLTCRLAKTPAVKVRLIAKARVAAIESDASHHAFLCPPIFLPIATPLAENQQELFLNSDIIETRLNLLAFLTVYILLASYHSSKTISKHI